MWSAEDEPNGIKIATVADRKVYILLYYTHFPLHWTNAARKCLQPPAYSPMVPQAVQISRASPVNQESYEHWAPALSLWVALTQCSWVLQLHSMHVLHNNRIYFCSVHHSPNKDGHKEKWGMRIPYLHPKNNVVNVQAKLSAQLICITSAHTTFNNSSSSQCFPSVCDWPQKQHLLTSNIRFLIKQGRIRCVCLPASLLFHRHTLKHRQTQACVNHIYLITIYSDPSVYS